MPAYLVTGRSGTGKSAICRELQNQGYTAYDGDAVPDLAGWENVQTGERIGKQYPGHDHVGKFKWEWDEAVLAKLLDQPGVVFLCGSANNALSFMDRFEKVFVLDIDEEEQRRRINSREEHDYGKDQAVQDSIIAYQKETVALARQHGATIVDANGTVKQVVEDILANI
jgi:dephospho-CoA kinase